MLVQMSGERNVHELLQQIAPVALVVSWFVGQGIWGLRYRAKLREYLRHFPPVEGIPLDRYVRGAGSRRIQRAIYRILWQRQDDPTLEQLRRATLSRLVVMALWAFGGLVLAIVIPQILFSGQSH